MRTKAKPILITSLRYIAAQLSEQASHLNHDDEGVRVVKERSRLRVTDTLPYMTDDQDMRDHCSAAVSAIVLVVFGMCKHGLDGPDQKGECEQSPKQLTQNVCAALTVAHEGGSHSDILNTMNGCEAPQHAVETQPNPFTMGGADYWTRMINSMRRTGFVHCLTDSERPVTEIFISQLSTPHSGADGHWGST